MKEREIDLLDMIADILSHWRGLLIAVVLGAILMGAFSYTRSYQNAQNMQPQEAEDASEGEMAMEEQLAQLRESLDDSQLAAVLTTVDAAKECALKKQYVQDSIYMQLDPMNWFTIFRKKMKMDLSAWEQSIEIPLTVSDCTTG